MMLRTTYFLRINDGKQFQWIFWALNPSSKNPHHRNSFLSSDGFGAPIRRWMGRGSTGPTLPSNGGPGRWIRPLNGRSGCPTIQRPLMWWYPARNLIVSTPNTILQLSDQWSHVFPSLLSDQSFFRFFKVIHLFTAQILDEIFLIYIFCANNRTLIFRWFELYFSFLSCGKYWSLSWLGGCLPFSSWSLSDGKRFDSMENLILCCSAKKSPILCNSVKKNLFLCWFKMFTVAFFLTI